MQDGIGNIQWITIGGWICWGNTVHTALGTRFQEMPPPAPPPPPPPPPRPPPPLPFSQLALSPSGFLPNVLDGAIGAVNMPLPQPSLMHGAIAAVNMPPRSPPPVSKKMRSQQKRRVSKELLERLRSLQTGFSQAQHAGALKMIVSSFRQQKRRVSKEWIESVGSLLTGFTQAQIAGVLQMSVSTFRRECTKVGAHCRFKQKLDPGTQRIRRNHYDLQYQRLHRELKGRINRLEEDCEVFGDRLYSQSSEIGIVGDDSGIREDMRFPGPAKVEVVPFQAIIACTQDRANRVKDMVKVRMSILPHLGLYG